MKWKKSVAVMMSAAMLISAAQTGVWASEFTDGDTAVQSEADSASAGTASAGNLNDIEVEAVSVSQAGSGSEMVRSTENRITACVGSDIKVTLTSTFNQNYTMYCEDKNAFSNWSLVSMTIQFTSEGMKYENVYTLHANKAYEGQIIIKGVGENARVISVSIKDHSWKTEPTVDRAATCTNPGLQSIHCSVCNIVQEGSEKEIPVAAHSWETEPTEDKAATCTEFGIKSIHCKVCGTIKEGSEEKIPVKGHSWDGVLTVDKEATCTEDGVAGYHCTVCGVSRQDVITPALGHFWGEWKQTVAPTQKEPGTEERVCARCGEKEQREIKPLLTKLDTVVINKPYVVSGDHVKLSWKAVENADGYHVYRKSGSKWVTIAICKGNVLTYTDKETKIGTKYQYTVKAYADTSKGKIYGGYNKTGVSITQAYYRRGVKLVSAKPVNYGTVQLSWEARPKSTGYIIYRKTPGSSWKRLATVGNVTSYTDKTCSGATTYIYTVKAYAKVGTKNVYTTYNQKGIFATTPIRTPKVQAKSVAGKTATVTWSRQNGVSGYAVYRKTAGGSWKRVKTLNSRTSTYTDTNLKSGATYYYTVRAYIRANSDRGITKNMYGAYNRTGAKVTIK